MLQLKSLCASLLVISLGASLLEGSVMFCEDNNECPEDHCCMQTGEGSICAELKTTGEFCELDAGENTSDHPYGQQNIYLGTCPCAPGLICSSAANSSSQESDVSAIIEIFGVCKSAEPETEGEE